MKLTKMQLAAVASVIKQEAETRIAEERNELKDRFKIEGKHEELVSLFSSIKHLTNEYNKLAEGLGLDPICISSSLCYSMTKEKLEDKILSNYLNKNTKRIDFSTLERDLVMASINSECLESLMDGIKVKLGIK